MLATPQENPFHVDVAAVAGIDAVPTILDIVCRTTGMGFAAVARVTEDHWIACGVQDGIGFGLRPGGELPVDTTICQDIRDQRSALFINDIEVDPVYRGHKAASKYRFRCYISVPIVLADGSFFGTLCAIDPHPHVVDTPAIAGSCRLFARLIAYQLDASLRIAASEASLSREREVAELREQFIAVLGHDLRNPLAAVSAGTRLLLRHPERATEIGEAMRQSIGRMAALIDNIMDFARGRLGDGLTLSRNDSAPVEPVLLQVIQELQSTHPDRAIEVDLALDQPVSCDRVRVGQLLSNLVSNALSHGEAGSPVRVRARTADGVFTLSVANTGPPIPSAVMENLFQPFFRGAVRASAQGLGLGLYIASEIARAHGGSLEAASDFGQTVFTFTMKLEP
jgi:signal transduction histidine kinase